MIVGIGVDSVEIERFQYWHTYSRKKLSRVFSSEEIDYCLSVSTKSAERFAARFAAKEAFFKAFCAAFSGAYVPFLTVCRYVSIRKDDTGRPDIAIEYSCFMKDLIKDYDFHISLTHTQSVATAFAIIEKI